MLNYQIILLLLVLCMTLGRSKYDSPMQYKPYEYNAKEGVELHPTETVEERGLVIDRVTQETVLDEYNRYSSQTNIKHSESTPILGFVTPWNNHGYDIAKIFKNKFTHISPCWFQIRRNEADMLYIAGEQDIDKKWIAELRTNCEADCPHIVPRFVWEANAFKPKDLSELLILIPDILEQYKFDGLVLEIGFSNGIIPIIRELRGVIGNLDMILTAHPESCDHIEDGQIFIADVTMYANFVILMSYDYSVRQGKIGPNSPYKYFVKSSLSGFYNLARKDLRVNAIHHAMIGLPFYGYDDRNAIIGSTYIDYLKKYTVEYQYKTIAQEHRMKFKDEKGKVHTIYYPTLKFISERIEFAKSIGCGVAIWELGQGLDYFMDLF